MVGDTDVEPAVAFPVEKFVPVQEAALADDHVSVDACPLVIVDGAAERLAVGVEPDETMIMACAVALPALPEQVTP